MRNRNWFLQAWHLHTSYNLHSIEKNCKRCRLHGKELNPSTPICCIDLAKYIEARKKKHNQIRSLHQDDKHMSYHNLAKYWNGDHILYTIYDIVLPAFLYLKPKHENLDPYHFIDFKIRQERNWIINRGYIVIGLKRNHSIDWGTSSNNL